MPARQKGPLAGVKAVDLARGNHRLLCEVNNRGNLLLLSLFNDAPWYYGIWSDLRNSDSNSDWDEMFNLA